MARAMDWVRSRRLVGEDEHHLFFSEFLGTGKPERRYVEYKDSDLTHSSDRMDVEWWAWLHNRRPTTPTAHELAQAARARAALADRVAIIQAEDERQRLRGGSSSGSSSSGGFDNVAVLVMNADDSKNEKKEEVELNRRKKEERRKEKTLQRLQTAAAAAKGKTTVLSTHVSIASGAAAAAAARNVHEEPSVRFRFSFRLLCSFYSATFSHVLYLTTIPSSGSSHTDSLTVCLVFCFASPRHRELEKTFNQAHGTHRQHQDGDGN